jgi:hypothetical protein
MPLDDIEPGLGGRIGVGAERVDPELAAHGPPGDVARTGDGLELVEVDDGEAPIVHGRRC